MRPAAPYACLLALASVAVGCTPPPDGIARVEPVALSTEGGDALRIEGAGFVGHGAPVVYVGAEHARAVVVHGNRLITALSPPLEGAGEVPVEIRFDDGTTYRAPRPLRVVHRRRTIRVGGS